MWPLPHRAILRLPEILSQAGCRRHGQAACGGACRLGAILTTEAVASRISPGLQGTTFGGGPLVCATALEFLKILEDEKVLQNIRARGDELKTGLNALCKKFDFIREVRGEGCMLGVELSVEGAPFVTEAMRQGLLINCTHDFTLRLLPAYLITKAQVQEFLGVFETSSGNRFQRPSVARATHRKLPPTPAVRRQGER